MINTYTATLKCKFSHPKYGKSYKFEEEYLSTIVSELEKNFGGKYTIRKKQDGGFDWIWSDNKIITKTVNFPKSNFR